MERIDKINNMDLAGFKLKPTVRFSNAGEEAFQLKTWSCLLLSQVQKIPE